MRNEKPEKWIEDLCIGDWVWLRDGQFQRSKHALGQVVERTPQRVRVKVEGWGGAPNEFRLSGRPHERWGHNYLECAATDKEVKEFKAKREAEKQAQHDRKAAKTRAEEHRAALVAPLEPRYSVSLAESRYSVSLAESRWSDRPGYELTIQGVSEEQVKEIVRKLAE